MRRSVRFAIAMMALAGTGLLAGNASAQRVSVASPPAASMPATMPATFPVAQAAGLGHLKIDVANRTIEMDAVVVLTDGALELLVCSAGTKEHESILATRARPSHLHAALLALGLLPGRAAHWAHAPDGKAVQAPPAGAGVEVWLRYADAAGQTHTVPASQWMVTLKDKAPAPPVGWVFVGSAILESGRYWADIEGEVISVGNFPGSVIDVPFESSIDNSLLDFGVNTKAVPAKGTAVTVIIKPQPGAQDAEVARAVFEIDRFGRYALDGHPMTPDQIIAWASDFKARHSRPYVAIHAAARALVFDVERLKSILADARITDIEVDMASVAGEILPRTNEQAAEQLKWWQDQFAQYKDLINEPGEQADVVLRQIDYRRKEVAEMLQMWAQYGQQLERALGAYRAATQPASAPAAPRSTLPASQSGNAGAGASAGARPRFGYQVHKDSLP